MSDDIHTTRASSETALRGQCLCGAVRYVVANAFRYAFNCHCSNCRRATGSAFKPFAGIERAALRFTQGEADLHCYGDPQAAHDATCRVCGSRLYSVVREGKWLHVTLGTLVDTPDIRPAAHIFVGSKAPWFTITDTLPQYDEFPP
ncbi:GFA family protein [Paraburkholderia acidisoli]|uniref:GFA family protein n=1 Tax=Paraburkholderia acidisoli TaxID=2571748 RepID=A0A7Z2GQI7_9BURK|nr:GFA family protein [Paraburkholderia acidisoli]QGZ65890.1 GFA family protein [Paraburkholderia acidisoli]